MKLKSRYPLSAETQSLLKTLLASDDALPALGTTEQQQALLKLRPVVARNQNESFEPVAFAGGDGDCNGQLLSETVTVDIDMGSTTDVSTDVTTSVVTTTVYWYPPGSDGPVPLSNGTTVPGNGDTGTSGNPSGDSGSSDSGSGDGRGLYWGDGDGSGDGSGDVSGDVSGDGG